MNSHRRLSYAAIAAALSLAKPNGRASSADGNASANFAWRETVLNLTDVLQAGNLKFNRKRFLLAAGVL